MSTKPKGGFSYTKPFRDSQETGETRWVVALKNTLSLPPIRVSISCLWLSWRAAFWLPTVWHCVPNSAATVPNSHSSLKQTVMPKGCPFLSTWSQKWKLVPITKASKSHHFKSLHFSILHINYRDCLGPSHVTSWFKLVCLGEYFTLLNLKQNESLKWSCDKTWSINDEHTAKEFIFSIIHFTR